MRRVVCIEVVVGDVLRVVNQDVFCLLVWSWEEVAIAKLVAELKLAVLPLLLKLYC